MLVRDVMLQRMLICFMKIGNIACDAWIRGKRSINDTGRKRFQYVDKYYAEHKGAENITGRHVVRLK